MNTPSTAPDELAQGMREGAGMSDLVVCDREVVGGIGDPQGALASAARSPLEAILRGR